MWRGPEWRDPAEGPPTFSSALRSSVCKSEQVVGGQWTWSRGGDATRCRARREGAGPTELTLATEKEQGAWRRSAQKSSRVWPACSSSLSSWPTATTQSSHTATAKSPSSLSLPALNADELIACGPAPRLLSPEKPLDLEEVGGGRRENRVQFEGHPPAYFPRKSGEKRIASVIPYPLMRVVLTPSFNCLDLYALDLLCYINTGI